MHPIDKRDFKRHVQAFSSEILSVAAAGRLTFAILAQWQNFCFPDLPLESRYGTKKFEGDYRVSDFVQFLAARPFLEAAFWLSSAYSAWVDRNYQTDKAMFFTPPFLANRVVDNLIYHGASLEKHVWFDPACGGGAFLVPVALRMKASMNLAQHSPAEIVQAVSTRLRGRDLDSNLAELTSAFLKMALYEEIVKSSMDPKFDISVGDSLAAITGEETADVVVCNPPYRKMSRAEVDVYREDFEDVIEGQPNLYGLFIKLCLSQSKNNGLIGLLTPTSYLSGLNFSRVREAMTSAGTVAQLDLIVNREGVFIGVEQEVAVAVVKRTELNITVDAVTAVFTSSSGQEFCQVGTCVLPRDGQTWAIPRSLGDAVILSGAGLSHFRLQDYGYLARVGAFVDYRDKRRAFKNRPKAERKALFPLIWSSDITGEGKLIHGRTSKEDGHRIYVDMIDKTHRSVVRRPAVVLQRVTSPDQDRRIACAVVEPSLFREFGGVVGENHVIFLEQVSESPVITPDELVLLMHSRSIDRLYRCISGTINVSLYELEHLPLPAPKILKRLLQSGKYSVDDAVSLAFVETPHFIDQDRFAVNEARPALLHARTEQHDGNSGEYPRRHSRKHTIA